MEKDKIYIIKRSGERVLFDSQKIKEAIRGANIDDPSISEIEEGCRTAVNSETGIPKSCISARARKIGSGRWAVCYTLTRYDGERRSSNVTAVLDGNGDIHYYFD